MKWIGPLLFFTGWLIILSFPSCMKKTEVWSYQEAFDLGSLVNNQIIYLSGNHYGVRKMSSLGQKEDVTEHYPDSAGWAKELDILKTADISKPGVRPYYAAESYESPLFLIDNFILTDTGRSNTMYQKIFRDKQTNRLARIQAEERVDNPIYHSGRYIEIVFRTIDEDVLIIDSIKVEGYQKIIFQDTAFYSSIAKIIR
jgi:hypothetical protein